MREALPTIRMPTTVIVGEEDYATPVKMARITSYNVCYTKLLRYTVLSKRKLIQLVTEKHVNGWDDPRMPTISGLRRRGYTSGALRNFCERIGVAKRDSTVDMALLEYCVREDLNKSAPRMMAVLNPLKIVIENYPEGQVEA